MSLQQVQRRALQEEEDHRGTLSLIALILGVLKGEDTLPAPYTNAFVDLTVWSDLREGRTPSGIELNALEGALFAHRSDPKLSVRGDISAVSLDRETWVSLIRRPIGRKIMRELIDAWPDPLEAWDLHDRVWPGVPISESPSRLYIAIHRLRELGLEDAIETSEAGYRLIFPPDQGA